MKFVYMEHKETKATHEFPDQPGVVEYWEARGWEKATPPPDKPFVSKHLDVDPAEDWVILYHPETKASHEFPNNPEAIEGAYDSGWELPKKVVAEEEKPEPEEKSKKVPAKKATSAKSADDSEKVT